MTHMGFSIQDAGVYKFGMIGSSRYYKSIPKPLDTLEVILTCMLLMLVMTQQLPFSLPQQEFAKLVVKKLFPIPKKTFSHSVRFCLLTGFKDFSSITIMFIENSRRFNIIFDICLHIAYRWNNTKLHPCWRNPYCLYNNKTLSW